MNKKISLTTDELNGMSPSKIVEHEKVEKKFVQMYNSIWGAQQGVSVFNKEKFNFQKLLSEKPELAKCSRLSLYGCFLDLAVNGLSLDATGRPHAYIIPRKAKTGLKDEKGKDIYEQRASVSITGYGELVMRMRAGQIKYVDNPVVVYEGDVFSAALNGGKKEITYRASIPRKSNKVIAAFIRIVRNDGSEDYQWLLEADIDRLKGYSARANKAWDDQNRCWIEKPNELYSSTNGGIDPGFLENKMIKHAFDAYPKVKTGKFTKLETYEEDEELDYGIEETSPRISSFDDAEDVTTEPAGTTVTVEPEDEDAGF